MVISMLIILIEMQALVQEFAISIEVSRKKQVNVLPLHFTYIMESVISKVRTKDFSQWVI